MKKITRNSFLKLMGVTAAAGVATACSSDDTTSTSTSTSTSTTTTDTAADVVEDEGEVELTLDRFVLGNVEENPSESSTVYRLINKFEELYPDTVVEPLVVTTDTCEQILKTSISSGDPFTLSQYWGTRVNTFYDNGMCLDLSDYVTDDFVNTFDATMMSVARGDDGEVWAIPFNTVFHTVFYNQEIFDKYGFSEPTTWADWTDIFAALKKDDVFGFTTNTASMQDCLYGITYAELETKVGAGTSYELASGNVSVLPGTEAGEVLRTCIQQVMDWYDAGYIYPGEGAVNTTADDANAAFSQGRAAMIVNYSGALGTHVASCDFEIGTFQKPTSEAGMTSYENIEPNVFFIPSNASEEQIEAGLAMLDLMDDLDVQQQVVNSGSIPAVLTHDYEDTSDTMLKLFDVMASGNVIAGINPTRTSSEMQTFVKQQIFAAPCARTMTIDETLEEMERIRLEAIS